MSKVIKIKEIIDFINKSLHDSKNPESIMSNCVKKGIKETENFNRQFAMTNQNKHLTYVLKTDIAKLCSIDFLFFKNILCKAIIDIPVKKILFVSNNKKLFQSMHNILCDMKFEHLEPPPPMIDDGSNDFWSELDRTMEPKYEEERKLEVIRKIYILRLKKKNSVSMPVYGKLTKRKDRISLRIDNMLARDSNAYYTQEKVDQWTEVEINYRNQLESLPKDVQIRYDWGFDKTPPKIHLVEYRCESCNEDTDYILSQRDDSKNIIFEGLNISSYIGKKLVCKKCKNMHTITKKDIVKSIDIAERSKLSPWLK